MKRIIYTAIVAMAAALISGCSKGEVDFTYSPGNPRCGQAISFSNTSTKGDTDSKWKWDFGDGTTSENKSASKIYRKSGIYMVSLTLNGKKHQRATREISVFDSVPTFSMSTSEISTYKTVTFTPLTYNPNRLALIYDWTIPDDAVVIDSVSAGITMYFKEKGDKEVILKTILGNDTTITKKTFYVYTTPAPSLIMATADGQILRQRIYDRGLANIDTITPKGIKLGKVSQLIADENNLYIFNMSNTTDGAIYVMHLGLYTVETLIQTTAAQSDSLYATGTIYNGNLYFTSKGNKAIYRIPTTARGVQFTDGKEQLFAEAGALKDFNSGDCGGIDIYGRLIYIGAENGIYRFSESDINSGSSPQTEPIEAGKIQNLKIDRIAGKIYFLEDKNLNVRNIDGSYPAGIVDGITSPYALGVSNSINYVIFNQENGVVALPLIQTRNNTFTYAMVSLSETDAVSMTIDEKERD